MKNQIQITPTELVNILNEIETPTFVSMDTQTKVRMNKRNNPYFDKVVKVKSGRYLIGSNYEGRVVNNDKKEGGEGQFQSQESSVGVHQSKCVLFNEKYNRYYLSHERFDEVKPKVSYTFEGRDIDRELFQDFEVKSSNYTNQPQDKKVKWMSVDINNIKSISLNGMKYEVV